MRVAVALAAWAAVAVLPACNAPRTPDSVEAVAEADGGELTCDERKRAQMVCQVALRQRCESQGNDCEAGCARIDVPENSTNITPIYNEARSTQCRENCRQVRDGCAHNVAQRCPAPCE